MDQIITFLNQPIVLTLVSLLVGGYLVSLISDRRSRKNTIRDQAIELLTEVGNDINAVTGSIYGRLRAKNIQEGRFQYINEMVGNLFVKRMSVRVRSEAYLNSEHFYRQYDTIVWELRFVLDCMVNLSGEYDLEQIIADIQKRKKSLSDVWPMNSERKTTDGEPPFNELLNWTDMIVDRARQLLSTHLQSVLK